MHRRGHDPDAAGPLLRPKVGYRADLQWMRGVAVALVVAYHTVVPGFEAGFVGVDIFFVLSGYLITRLLVVEHDRSGSIDIGSFMARRVRRLLPASTLVLVATVGLWTAVGSSLERFREGLLAMGAAFLGANVTLAQQGRDYLGGGRGDTPFEHWWSLGVEEQFYLVLPVLLVALLTAARRWSGGSGASDRGLRASRSDASGGRLLLGVLGVLFVASLTWGAVQTWRDPVGAYVLLPARAWQLLAGGLLAVCELRGWTPARGMRASLRWMGWAWLAAALLLIDSSTPYPGVAALVPTGAALALVAGGIGTDHRERDAAAAEQGPWARALAWVGDRSYALYLWHWPLLVVLARTTVGHAARVEQLAPWLRVGAVAVATVLAHVTLRIVEEPLRRASWLIGRRRRIAAFGSALLLLGGSTSALARVSAEGTVQRQLAGASTDIDGASADVLLEGELPPPANEREVLHPPPELARADFPYRDSCNVGRDGTDLAPPAQCQFGDAAADRTVLLVGDSHAAMWTRPVDEFAEAFGFRGEALWKPGCSPYPGTPAVEPAKGRPQPSCPVWREKAMERVGDVQPDMIVLGTWTNHVEMDVEDWAAALPAGVREYRRLAPDADIVILGDSPTMPDVPQCLNLHGYDDASACRGEPRSEIRDLEARTAAALDDVVHVDIIPHVCRDGSCPPVVGDVLAYQDKHHFTSTFARALVGVFTEDVRPLL